MSTKYKHSKNKFNYEKLAELAKEFNLKLEINLLNSRCPKCNFKIRSVKKEEVIEKIPLLTYKFYFEFWECTNCGKIYWQGSHWEAMTQTLQKLLGEK